MLVVRRIFRFGAVGVAATGIHVVVAAYLIGSRGLHPTIGNGIAFVCAMVSSYVGNALWSFQQNLSGQTFIRFIAVSLAGLTATLAISGVANAIGMHYFVGIGAVVVLVPMLTFLLHSVWTFGASDANRFVE